ncbi:MAG: hypothetical protein IK116_02705 [Firmicutes bacterium]|nr:hypothetical protein [Bacillota bacterium]
MDENTTQSQAPAAQSSLGKVSLRIREANCADCYRCVRYCPVKAIRVDNSHPYIMRKLCISCGSCLDICLQKAVRATSDLDYVRQLLQSGQPIALSLSPVCLISREGGAAKLISDLRRLGFTYISELAEGAQLAASRALELAREGKGCIYSNCPAAINYIRQYRHDALPYLIPVVSPFLAHGRMLKQRYGNCPVVIVSSCISTKFELNQEDAVGAVDAVITTSELYRLLEDRADDPIAEDLQLEAPPAEDEHLAPEMGQLDFTNLTDGPLEGARKYCLREVDMRQCSGHADLELPGKFIHVRGLSQINDMLDLIQEKHDYALVDMVFCESDCLLGPLRKLEGNSLRIKRSILDYARETYQPAEIAAATVDLTAHFTPGQRPEPKPVEQEDILRVYREMDMLDPASRLNCGSCGYPTCRDRAIAQIRGMAERQMCRPWLRKQVAAVHSEMELLQEHAPLGIVMLDDELNIISMNPAFRKMFMCGDAVLGRRISYLFNSSNFVKLLMSEDTTSEAIRTNYGVRYKEIAFAIPEQRRYVGLYVDLTSSGAEADLVQYEVINQAQQLLKEHISASQEMAYYLGRSTARSEAFVQRLSELFGMDREEE